MVMLRWSPDREYELGQRGALRAFCAGGIRGGAGSERGFGGGDRALCNAIGPATPRPDAPGSARAVPGLTASIDRRADSIDPAVLLARGVAQADVDLIAAHVAAQAPGG